ncbi:MAG TPA: heme-copper oxidase subunit III [Acidimicrobiia bacterium]|jgi:heme/copper-type cytochrome/quinol oxidase subunit 3
MSQATLPVTTAPRDRGYSTAWWGMVVLITTEAMIFLALLSAYFFIRASVPRWPIGGLPEPELHRSVIFTVILLASSIPIVWMEVALKRGNMRQVKGTLLLAFLMGAAFLGNTAYDYTHMDFGWRVNAYSSLFWGIIGLHALHVLVGLLMSATVQVKVWLGKVSPERHTTPEVFALYWHFVDGVWIFVFTSLILSPHFGR